jgi:hypothetical protein
VTGDGNAREPAGATRGPFLAIVLVVLLALIAGSFPRRVGDGAEYLAMALRLADGKRPSLSDDELAAMQAYFVQLDTGFADANSTLAPPGLVGADGRHDFPHFWFYPALAAPGVALALRAGVHPNYGFVAVNVLAALAAAWVVTGRIGWPATLLLFVGPIVWWIDKAHTEVFTVALLSIGLAVAREQPWWAMLAFATAATQNQPIALAVPLVALGATIGHPQLWRDRRLWMGATAAACVLVIHPLYYWLRLGVLEPQTLVHGTDPHPPTVAQMAAFAVDPNVGLLPNFPLFGPVLAAATIVVARRDRRALLTPSIVVATCLAFGFLAAFAQTTNVNSGATPGPARYGMWLVPLAIPLLGEASRVGGARWHRMLGAVSVGSALWALVAYAPALRESYVTPTRLAAFLWEQHPAWSDPLPEIFAERLLHREVNDALEPAATPTCSKVLIVGGAWPSSCPKPDIPVRCRGARSRCYANRRARGGYRFSST